MVEPYNALDWLVIPVFFLIMLIVFLLTTKKKKPTKVYTPDDVIDHIIKNVGLHMYRLDKEDFDLFMMVSDILPYYTRMFNRVSQSVYTEEKTEFIIKNLYIKEYNKHCVHRELTSFMLYKTTALYKPESYHDVYMEGDGVAKCTKCGGFNTYCDTESEEDNDEVKIDRLYGVCRDCDHKFPHIYKQTTFIY